MLPAPRDSYLYEAEEDPQHPKSPGLQAVQVTYSPDKKPPPFLPEHVRRSTDGPGSRTNRRKVKPNQGDVVLLETTNPNRPDIARTIGNQGLRFSSSPEESPIDDTNVDEPDLDEIVAKKIEEEERERQRKEQEERSKMAATIQCRMVPAPVDYPSRRPGSFHSYIRQPAPFTPSTASLPTVPASTPLPPTNGLNIISGVPRRLNNSQVSTDRGPAPLRSPPTQSLFSPPTPNFQRPRSPPATSCPASHSLTTSPTGTHRYPASPETATILPALQTAAIPEARSNPTSPQQQLPPARQLLDFADKENRHRARQASVSSTHNSYHYFAAPSPFSSATSPTNIDSAISVPSPRDFGHRGSIPTPISSVTSPQNFTGLMSSIRRPSQASDHTASTVSSYGGQSVNSAASVASTVDSYSPSEHAFSPHSASTATSHTTPSERSLRLSTDTGRHHLPPPPLSAAPSHNLAPLSISTANKGVPNGPLSAGAMSASGMSAGVPTPSSAASVSASSQQQALQQGTFQCKHPECTAQPFQTQYLLNSHATVHSSDRPHYCPVDGCPRGLSGKGFKRKNEMIRHGLVHESPGYVCPFCPEREHRYPRPDNLQRHVRVHHADVDKLDPRLREVLERRVGGFGRGPPVSAIPGAGTGRVGRRRRGGG